MTYVLTEPFEKAVKEVSRAIRDKGLHVFEVLDLSDAIEGMLGVNIRRCVVLCILASGSSRLCQSLAGLLAVHVAIVPRDSHAEIHICGPLHRNGLLPSEVVDPIIEVQMRLTTALDGIAMRQSECSIILTNGKGSAV